MKIFKYFILIHSLLSCLLSLAQGSNYTFAIEGDVIYCGETNVRTYTSVGVDVSNWIVNGGVILSYPAPNQVTIQWSSDVGTINGHTEYTYNVCNEWYDEYGFYHNDCSQVTDYYTGNLTVSKFDISVTLSPNQNILCEGNPITIDAFPNNYSFQWRKDGLDIQGATASSLSVFTGGNFSALAKFPGCMDVVKSVNITFQNKPSIPVVSSSVNEAAANAIILTATNGSNYRWYKDNVMIQGPTSDNPVIQAFTSGTYKVENKVGLCSSFSLPVEVNLQSLNGDFPNVVSNVIKQPSILSEAGVTTQLNNINVIEQKFNYINRLGQPLQTVLKANSPTGKDVISFHEYDAFGRESKVYLPVSSNKSDGKYLPNIAGEANGQHSNSYHHQFYNNITSDPANLIPDDPKPFTLSIYENSPLGRVIEQGQIGDGYQPIPNATNTPTSKFAFGTNANNEVLQFTIQEYGSDFFTIEKGFYPTNTLSKQTVKTPKQNDIVEFTNSAGKTVHRKTQLDATTWAETYYVYDSRDNLRFILTPELVKYIQDNNLNSISSEQPLNLITTNTSLATANNSNAYPYQNGASITLAPGFTSANGFIAKPLGNTTYTINRYAYQFKYDYRNRRIAEKAPGADWTYFIYDNQDRPILTQPPHLRASNQWEFTKYDRFQRVILTGLVTLTQTVTELRTLVNNHAVLYEDPSTTNAVHGYTNLAFPNQPNENLYQSITYYDNYTCLSGFPAGTTWTYQPALLSNLPAQAHNRIKGSVTGTKIRVVGTADWLYATQYYDERGRVIQSIGTNHLGGNDISSTQFDFTGKVLATRLHHNNGQQQYVITEEFEYDAVGRTLRHFHQLGNTIADRVLLEEFAYNELGDLVTHKLHQKSDQSFLQTIQLRSNIRGQLLSQTSEDFQQTMGYDNTQGLPNVLPSYAGEISSITTMHNVSANNMQYAWTFNYDKQSQLTGSEQWQKAVAANVWTQPLNPIKESNFSYDLNGNIQSLTRFSANGTIDNLQYNYGTGNAKSNQLLSISDATQNNDGFKDGNTAGNDYVYDVAGNLTQDLNKNISSITYNELNLTQQITVTGVGYLTYLYTADGTKLADMLYSHTNQLLKRTDYATPFIYEQDFTQGNQRKLHSIQTATGRVLPIPIGGYEYQYVLTDHLGSARMILSASPRTYTYKATMETANATTEEMLFTNVTETRADAIPTTINQTPGGSKVAALNVAKPIGPALSLQVFPGDVINANVYVNHAGSGYGNTRITMTNLVSALVGAFGGGALTPGEAASLSNSFETNFNAEGLLAAPTDNLPAAYLNFIVFDLEMNPIDMGYTRAGSSSGVISRNNITITEPGYIYLYVSNEGSTSTHVYFDDFTITLNESKLCGTYHNYPFGANIAELQLERWRMPSNQYRYQGKQYEDAMGINLHDFHARLYGAYEARWFAMDPAGQFVTPYSAMANNPISSTDPDGKIVPVLIGLGVGMLTGYISGRANGLRGNDLLKYTFENGVIGAISGGVGAGFGNLAVNYTSSAFLGSIVGGATGGAVAGTLNSASNGGNIGDGALNGALGGALGGMIGLNVPGILPGAFVGGLSGGVTGGLIEKYVNKGDFWDGFEQGALSGAISGGIYGGYSAATSKYDRRILWGNATKAGKQALINDLIIDYDAINKGLNNVILDNNLQQDKHGGARPIINGTEVNDLRVAFANSSKGTRSNIYLGYKGRSLRAIESTFIHELVHVNDYYTGFTNSFFKLTGGNMHITRAMVEYRAYRRNIEFGYNRNTYIRTIRDVKQALNAAGY